VFEHRGQHTRIPERERNWERKSYSTRRRGGKGQRKGDAGERSPQPEKGRKLWEFRRAKKRKLDVKKERKERRRKHQTEGGE